MSTRTEIALIAKIEAARARGESSLSVDNYRDCIAARRLAEKGVAKSYKSMSRSHVGESYFNHFHRCWATRKPYTSFAGVLYI